MNLGFGVAKEHASEPVQLDLEEIRGGAERSRGRGRLHRPQLRGKALELDLELVRVHGSRLAPVLRKLCGAPSSLRGLPSRARRVTSWQRRPTPSKPPSSP